MKANRFKIFGGVMAVVLAVTLAGAGVVQNSDPTSAESSLKWNEIPIPEEGMDGGYVLWGDSDVGPIAVSPEGDTVFAAVVKASVNWTMLLSTDGGYNWRETGVVDRLVESADTGDIVDIVVSPNWDYQETVLVATTNYIYTSDDGSVSFKSPIDIGGNINSLDAALDEYGNPTYLAGTDNGVYLKREGASWDEQGVGGSALDAAFSPTYGDDGGYSGFGQIAAVVTDSSQTMVRFRVGDENWDTSISDAILYDQTAGSGNTSFKSNYGCMAFPGSYNASTPILFVGVAGAGNQGDAYKIEGRGPVAASLATDLDVRDNSIFVKTHTDIWSIAVTGYVDEATILVGTEALNTGITPKQHLVYVSTDWGENWKPEDTIYSKQPTGEEKANVIMAPGAQYVSTSGAESAFSASADDDMLYWNQRGLIDTGIIKINDVAPSPNYAADSNLLMATVSWASTASLWQTTDMGATWERIYCSTITEQLTDHQCLFDMVKLCPDFPTDAGIFLAQKDYSPYIYRSNDGGISFQKEITATENITAWEVVNTSNLFTGAASGSVRKWETSTGGDNWTDTVKSEITGEVTSLVAGPGHAILAGDDNGRAYICESYSGDFSFEREGTGGPGDSSDVIMVAFDDDYADNDIIYASSNPGGDIYRKAVGDGSFWDNITEYGPAAGPGPAAGIDATGLVVTDDGILYASDMRTGMGVARSVNPTYPMEEAGPEFEMMDTGLPPNTTLNMLRVVPGSSILFAVNDAPSPDQLLTCTDTLTEKVSLASPGDGITTGFILEEGGIYAGMARVMLSWEAMTGALDYEWEIALDEEFRSPAEVGSGGLVTGAVLWLGKKYYWRVRVIEPLLSRWSETRSFTTYIGPAAALPKLVSPVVGQIDMPLKIVLAWSSVIEGTKYELVVAEDCDWADLLVDKTDSNALGPETIYVIPSGSLKYDTQYCWKVRALSDITESPWSNTGTFTTIAEPVVEEEEPTPFWVWVVIGITLTLLLILLVSWVVLIARTRMAR